AIDERHTRGRRATLRAVRVRPAAGRALAAPTRRRDLGRAGGRAVIARTAEVGHNPGIESLLSAKEIIIACGSGGVGKTTTVATAAAMAAIHLEGRVLALTVDPAKRLANALGLQQVGNTETRVPVQAFTDAGVKARGEL